MNLIKGIKPGYQSASPGLRQCLDDTCAMDRMSESFNTDDLQAERPAIIAVGWATFSGVNLLPSIDFVSLGCAASGLIFRSALLYEKR
ncbi:hypothetical protein [Cerasicoccus fimbriatus]|uniref:hypothetical protein n=1 Tax=Cerasicoccus fimbriatus TaxID=3014554 RepID=UPI0022B37FD6|nr:hypothetical protein [Cerasicoccus sp. TK19100]